MPSAEVFFLYRPLTVCLSADTAAEGKRGQDTKHGFGRSPLSSFPRRARIK